MDKDNKSGAAEWSWDSSLSFVSHFTAVDARTFEFELSVMMRHRGDGMCQLEYSGSSTVNSLSVVDTSQRQPDHAEWTIAIKPDFTIFPRDNCQIIPSPPVEMALHDLTKLKLPMNQFDKIEKYISGVVGDPLAISGRIGRMIYFSAVVITTLGFGDIVPMTALSRTLVAIETIFGLITVGLFLNAVAFHARGR